MGCTPWSPLKNGVLSGKYRRGVTVEAARGAFVQASLTERAYAIIDEVARIAAELGSTVARVALAWLCDRPGVTSPILGVRTVAQLDDNVGALALRLAPAHVAALDDVSRPALPFPAPYSDFAAILQRGGMTIDGHSLPRSPISP